MRPLVCPTWPFWNQLFPHIQRSATLIGSHLGHACWGMLQNCLHPASLRVSTRLYVVGTLSCWGQPGHESHSPGDSTQPPAVASSTRPIYRNLTWLSCGQATVEGPGQEWASIMESDQLLESEGGGSEPAVRGGLAVMLILNLSLTWSPGWNK